MAANRQPNNSRGGKSKIDLDLNLFLLRCRFHSIPAFVEKVNITGMDDLIYVMSFTVTKIKFNGPLSMRLSSFFKLNSIGLRTYTRHAFGWKMEPSWDATFEIGILFWRHQFTMAMRQTDFTKGRQILDSLQTETDDTYDVQVESGKDDGDWYTPQAKLTNATLLYLHGGGYAFHGAMSKRFAAMLAHHCGARLFAPDYRLTPEHPHPAQSEDALAAYRYLMERSSAKNLVIIGDSAGGHMALTLLQTLRAEGLPQPALCIGLCPWTDVGDRGASLHVNDKFDFVQGWMALRFGEWLDPNGYSGRETLSPMSLDYKGLAPIYLQAGGKEILCDMIREFAVAQVKRGASLMLDIWPDMPHDFQAFDSVKQSSSEALERICSAILFYIDRKGNFTHGSNSVELGALAM
jgi:epsilon-lactone hydrolase